MGNSLAAAKFRGFVEILCDEERMEELTEEEFSKVVEQADLFNLQLDLKDFLSKFTLEDAKWLWKTKPRHASWLLVTCADNLDHELSQFILCRLIPSHFIVFSDLPQREEDHGSKSTDEQDLEDVVHFASQHCLTEELKTVHLERLFILLNSQTLFSKRVCLNRELASELHLPQGLVIKLFTGLCTSKQLHCLAILSDLKHDEFLDAWEKDSLARVVSLLKNRVDSRRGLVPSLVLLLRLGEEDGLKLITDIGTDSCARDLAELMLLFAQCIADYCKTGEKQQHHLRDPSLVQLCSVVLLCFSSSRKLGLALNSLLASSLDNLFRSIAVFVSEGEYVAFAPLQRLCLTALCNMSFYFKSLSMTSSTCLVSLFERCVKHKRFDQAKQLVQFFSNILQYQSQGNAPLLYCMLRAKPMLTSLAASMTETSTLEKDEDLDLCILALAEVEKELPQSNRGDDGIQGILKQIAQVSLIGALPVPKPMLVCRYARTDKIDQVVRKTFWLDLYQNSEEYWDYWTGA